MASAPRHLITCEHGGHEVPSDLRGCFSGASDILRSHEGWDPGALDVAVALAAALPAPLLATRISRLVVECNRSLHHPRLLSAFTRPLPAPLRAGIIDRFWHPYRKAVEDQIAAIPRGEQVRHFSVHSFTPVLNGVVRELEIGILFDPSRPRERTLARAVRDTLRVLRPDWRIRLNAPYRGTADGFTTFLRTQHPDPRYQGLEIEINQHLLHRPRERTRLGTLLAEALTGC